ncbi:MAG TPA: hypothetical protein VHC48_02005, partial [Puia sp.]|nr:hypothetical protein [Puia sp.]
MRDVFIRMCFTLCVLCCFHSTYSQQTDSTLDKLTGIPDGFINRLRNKISGLDRQVARQSEKYLEKMARREERLAKKLRETYPGVDTRSFTNASAQYAALKQKINADTGDSKSASAGTYLPHADSMRLSLAFLQQNPSLLASAKGMEGKLQAASANFQQLQAKLVDADQARQFIKDRKEQVRQYLSQYSHLPSSITKEYQEMNRDLYNYTQQVRQYKETLNDPDKLGQTALDLLHKAPAFNDFVQRNSQLALLFGSPAAAATPGSQTGLQLRTDIQQLLSRQLGSQGIDAVSSVGQNLQSAQSALSGVRDRVSRWGPDGKDIDDPNFKPNDMATKSLWKRLEYGVNVQTQHSSYYYPTTTDLGFSLGYRLSNTSVIGIGASAKIGWGSDIQHIRMSGNGLGLRSFVDIQLKKTYYISGGFEYNYQDTYTSLRQIPQFKY